MRATRIAFASSSDHASSDLARPVRLLGRAGLLGRVALVALVALPLATACSSSSSASPGPATEVDAEAPSEEDASVSSDDAGAADAAPDAPPITGECAASFGNGLTEGFGRLDGVVYAVQKPSDKQCVMPNDDHLVLQILWAGGVYRMVVNVLANGADTKVRYGVFPHALPAPAFAAGWHTQVALDYVTDLGVHVGEGFESLEMDPLVDAIAKELTPGAPVAVYATSGAGRPESTHLIHRNKSKQDGAIVVSPNASPKFLLFHFATQTF